MKQEHQIMLAQRKNLEKQLIENYNVSESIRKANEVRAQKSARKQDNIVMLKGE